MSFEKCIRAKIKEGEVTPAKGKELINAYSQLVDKYVVSMGDVGAAQAAAAKIVGIQEKVLRKEMHNKMMHAFYLDTVKADIDARAAVIQAEKDKAKTGKVFFGNPYVRAIREKIQAISHRQGAIRNMSFHKISDIIEEFRSKNGGFSQDVQGFKQVVRAMGDESIGGEAAVMGKAIREVFDDLHRRFEAAGGILGKIDNYFPQYHLAERVGEVPFEDWFGFIRPLLDKEKMVDIDTGIPMSDKRLKEAMFQAYESIRTNGLIDVATKAAEGGQALRIGGDIAKRAASSRFIHFKDMDSFLKYNQRFGKGDEGLFDVVRGHIESMSRDIALMEDFGPKANSLMRNLLLEQEARGVGAKTKDITEAMYNTVAGNNSFSGELGTFTKMHDGWLHLKRAAYLGSAPISALSDTYFIHSAARLNGLSGVGAMKQYFKLLNPLNDADRRIARRHFFVASAASGTGLQGARFSDEIGRGGKMAFLSGVTNRISGLAAMTDAGKAAASMQLSGTVAELITTGTRWADLDPALRNMAETMEINEGHWNEILQTKPSTFSDVDADFLLPEDIAKGGNVELATRYAAWLEAIGNLAVNEPNILSRAITSGAIIDKTGKQGSFARLISSNVFFAKSFPVTVMINHTIPALREAVQGRFGRLGSMVVATTLLGAFATQVRQIATGKDTRDTNDVGFWMQSMLQGGGLGLFGDFMFGDRTRAFGSKSTLASPILGTIESLIGAGDLAHLGTEKDFSKVMGDVWKIVNKEIPTVRLWYTRLLVERFLFDQVEKAINPSYDKRMRMIEKRMQKEMGQEFWWKPAETSPRRSPKL